MKTSSKVSALDRAAAEYQAELIAQVLREALREHRIAEWHNKALAGETTPLPELIQ